MRENRERGEKVGFTQRKHWLFSWGEEVISGSLSLSFSFLFRIISSSLVFNSGNVFLPFFPFFFALFFPSFSSFFKNNLPSRLPSNQDNARSGRWSISIEVSESCLIYTILVWGPPTWNIFPSLYCCSPTIQTLTSEIWNLGKRSGKE